MIMASQYYNFIKGGKRMRCRKAVGAVVESNNEYLIVHKVKINDGKTRISGSWDLVKGGVFPYETKREALSRELMEETGLSNYKIIKEFDEKIVFKFPDSLTDLIGYDLQETTVFHVYIKNKSEIQLNDPEIDAFKFVTKSELCKIINKKETSAFILKHYQS